MLPDRVINALDNALRTLCAAPAASRPCPGAALPPAALDDHERREAVRLMRVDHVGEICAQALYQGQLLGVQEPATRDLLERAAREERDHLAWTAQRLDELGGRTSALNPVWYALSFALGAASGLLGDRVSLGFLEETEKQVEAHLGRHLAVFPEGDPRSQAVLAQMQSDEAAHALSARGQGAQTLPRPVREGMRLGARLMTGTARWL